MSIHKSIRLPAIVCTIFLLAMVNLNIWHVQRRANQFLRRHRKPIAPEPPWASRL